MHSVTPTPTERLAAFAHLASDFCEWCLTVPRPDEDSASLVSSWIGRLHASALELEEPTTDDVGDWIDIPVELTQACDRRFKPLGYFYRQSIKIDPSSDDDSIGIGDIHDDLTDIFRDVHRGVVMYVRGDDHAAWRQWYVFHRAHWGKHAVEAMLALHQLVIAKRPIRY